MEAKIKEAHIISDQENPVGLCGICRQSLAEFASPGLKIYCHGAEFKKSQVYTINQLLPEAFTFF